MYQMWSARRYWIVASILCSYSHAFLGYNQQMKTRCPFQVTPLFDEKSNPRTDRDMSYGMIQKSTENLLKVSSVLLLSQLAATMLPSKANAAGYQAAPSAFASNDYLYTAPLLPQSALLNSLPIQDELVAELQAYLESFVQLINPSEAQENQIERNDSILWTNLRINAQRAAGMFIYNKNELLPDNNTNFNSETAETQRLRRGLSEDYLVTMQQDVLRLVNGSRKSSVSESLRYMRRSLNGLCNVAYMLYPLNRVVPTILPSSAVDAEIDREREREKRDVERIEEKKRKKVEGNVLFSTSDPTNYSNIPRLDGRATVVLTFQRSNANLNFANNLPADKIEKRPDRACVTIVVDGINHPLTGGNFVDLCLKGIYNNVPVNFEPFEYDHESVNRTVFGFDKGGYTDEKTGKKRQIPLEVLRDARDKNTPKRAKGKTSDIKSSDTAAKNLETIDGKISIINSDSSSRFTAVGLARNSPVFTKAAPVLSFATNGAIGMMHGVGDENGASQGFFWVQVDRSLSVSERHQSSVISKMNNRFSLFAHVVEGNDVMDLLRPGDMLVHADVKDESLGTYTLVNAEDETSSVIPFEEEED